MESQLRLMAVHAHPDDESSKGAATMARYVREGSQVMVVHADRRGARRHPQPGDGPARDQGRHRRGAAGGDGAGQGDPRRRAALSRLRRLGAARGRPEAAAARGLLRADAARRGGRAAGPRDTRVPAARDAHLRRERRLSAPGPRDDPPGQRGGVRGRRRPGRLPRVRRALAAAQAVLLRVLSRGEVRGLARGDAPPRPGVARTPRSSKNGRTGRKSAATTGASSRSPRRCRAATTSRSGTRR